MGGGTQTDQLVCVICRQLPKTVLEASCCTALYCKSCVVNLLSAGDVNCTICGKYVRKFQLNVPLQRIIDQQEAKCRFEALGCTVRVEFKDLETHEANCEFALVDCPSRCGSSLVSKDLKEHVNSKCPLRMVKCPNGKCDKSMPFALLELHINTDCKYIRAKCPHCFKEMFLKSMGDHIDHKCPEVLVSCPYSQCGCCERLPRKQLPLHVDANVRLHLQLVLKTVNKQQAHIEKLTNELNSMRHQKVSFVDLIQEAADSIINSCSKSNLPSWLTSWERCNFNLMHVWVLFMFFLQFIIFWELFHGNMIHSGCFMSITIYGVFMGYYYFIHTMDDIAWYWKLGATVYFMCAWAVLSALVIA